MNLYYKIKNKLFYDVDCLRARWQRFMRGYSYGDVWDMDNWFMRTVKPMLIHLRDHHCGVPIEFEHDDKAWCDILTDMISCLNMMDESQVYKELGFNNRLNMTKEDYETVYRVMENSKNRFFELFGKHFYSLWD